MFSMIWLTTVCRHLGACPSIERILLAKDERVGFHLPHEQDIPRLED
jgi:hypothetical protein